MHTAQPPEQLPGFSARVALHFHHKSRFWAAGAHASAHPADCTTNWSTRNCGSGNQARQRRLRRSQPQDDLVHATNGVPRGAHSTLQRQARAEQRAAWHLRAGAGAAASCGAQQRGGRFIQVQGLRVVRGDVRQQRAARQACGRHGHAADGMAECQMPVLGQQQRQGGRALREGGVQTRGCGVVRCKDFLAVGVRGGV